MARSKQREDEKAKRGGKKELPDEIVEGIAVEKATIDQADQIDGQDGQTWLKSSSGFSWMILISLALSVMAVAAWVFLHYKIDNNSQQAVDARSEALARFNDVLGDRLNGVETRLITLETAVENLRLETEQIEVKVRETVNANVNEFTAVQSAMTVRLNDLEARLADVLAAKLLVSDADVQDKAVSTDDLAGNLIANRTMPDQLAVLIVMGLLSDNAAGRSLTRWAPALSSYAETDSVPARVGEAVKAVITSINASPPLADSLLAEGAELAAMMAIGVNEAGEDASLFDRVMASLGKMLRIRSTRMTGDDPRSQLARFDFALSRRDLVAASDIAAGWNGPALKSLKIWHQNTLSRFALDQALADLTAAIVGMVD